MKSSIGELEKEMNPRVGGRGVNRFVTAGHTEWSAPVLATACVSASGTHKAEILRRPEGTLQVRLFRWHVEHAPGVGQVGAFWEAVHLPVTITDNMDRARALAQEMLRERAEAGGFGGAVAAGP